MSRTYAIDDAHGAQITCGLPEGEARPAAEAIATRLGERVWLYREGDPAPAVEVRPRVDAVVSSVSSFMFGVERGRRTAAEVRKRERVARRHGAWYIYGDFPGLGLQGWFEVRNYGEPFNRAVARAVLSDLKGDLKGGAS